MSLLKPRPQTKPQSEQSPSKQVTKGIPEAKFLKPTSRPWKKQMPWVLLGLGLTTVTVLALRPVPISVELGAVTPGDLTVSINAEGQTRVKNPFIVAAPVTGRLSRIDREVGDSIQAGERLATLDPLPLTTQVKTAQAQLSELNAQLAGVETQRPKLASLSMAQANIRAAEAAKEEVEARISEAKAALAQSKLDRDRAQSLFADGVIPRQQRESAELLVIQNQQGLEVLYRQQEKAIAEIKSAQESYQVLLAEREDPDYLKQVYKAQINAVEAELTNLANEVSQTQVYAPISGKVLRLEQESARFVQAGMPLLEIGNPRDLELVIDVLSTDAVKIKPGNTIILEQWGGDEPLLGQVKYIEPAAFTEISALGVDEQRVNVVGTILSPNITLGSNYRVEAKINIWEGKNVLKVPVSALYRCQESWCVFVEQMGKAQQRSIAIAQRNESEAVVLKGLSSNEKVILHPAETIQSGTRVQAR